jgi:oligoendopeptidase F
MAHPTSTEFPRRFLAADVSFDQWAAAEPYYRDLAERPLNTLADVERWLLDWSELDAAFDEEGTARYIAMTCGTDDPQRQAAYLHFCENVKPPREPWLHQLKQKLVDAAARVELPKKRYEVLLRSVENAIALYRDENVPLKTEDEKLSTEYQTITGGLSATYRGEELTIPGLLKYQEETDRATREETWRLAMQAYLAQQPALDALYEKMVVLRHRMAQNAGFSNYVEYRFRELERFDYTPADCFAFHDAIEKVVLPAARALRAERRQKLRLDRLRPWDTEVDPAGREPLRPFETVEQLVARCRDVFAAIHVDFGRIFEELDKGNLLDLASRKGKAPGGYQSTYHERRLPFIFMNAVGTDDDVRTLLHEGGHAFHTWACRADPLLLYRNYPTEFAEVASMGMECLALPHMKLFYDGQEPRARRSFFEGIVNFFPYMAQVDAFQHYVYTHVDAGLEDWKRCWLRLQQRFDTGVDWTGLEEEARHGWHRKLHIFEVPLYYVEYGIAQLGALQVWQNARKDPASAVALYRQGLSLGGSRPLPELFEAAGCRFDFTAATMQPLIDAVMAEIRSVAD